MRTGFFVFVTKVGRDVFQSFKYHESIIAKLIPKRYNVIHFIFRFMMIKFLSLIGLLSLSLFARQELHPVKACSAFNNMKHTKNSHNVILDTHKTYTVLEHHKGQNLILVKGEQPAQRWVEESCFYKAYTPGTGNSVDEAILKLDKDTGSSKHTKKYEMNKISQKNLLALSWHNAFCETHRSKKECKRDITSLFRSKHHERNFILHGYWPQPQNKAYCGVEQKYITMDKYRHWHKLPNPGLTEKMTKRLTKIMPGVVSNLHKHEWYKHGTCYGTDAQSYFSTAIALVEQLYRSRVSAFFEKNIGKRVTLKQIRTEFDRGFGTGSGKNVELRCKNGRITELWLHLEGTGDDLGSLLKRGKQIRNRCQRGLLDRAGFTKETSTKAGFGR